MAKNSHKEARPAAPQAPVTVAAPVAPPVPVPAAPVPPAEASNAADVAERQAEDRARAAEAETKKAEDEGRLPATMAVTNPAPSNEMDSGSGAFVEREIKESIPADHPAVENNPRKGTSAVQNGGDFNDPAHRDPKDPGFSGQGLDLSVYGAAAPPR